MNKELVVYTSFSQVMFQEIAVFFYPSKLVPDFFEYYVIVCCKLMYNSMHCLPNIYVYFEFEKENTIS